MTRTNLRHSIENALDQERIRSVFYVILGPLSLLYRLTMIWRRWLYRVMILPRMRLPGRTISVGNIQMGGTGKSPVTMEIAKVVRSLGCDPVILSRGYGTSFQRGESLALIGGQVLYDVRKTIHSPIPDEPSMMAHLLAHVPVVVGPNRVEAAQTFLQAYNMNPDNIVWILDDGFQHLKIHRDMDIVLVDSAKPRRRVFPLGLAREGCEALSDAGCLIYTRATHKLSPLRFSGSTLHAQFVTDLPTFDVSGDVNFSAAAHTPLFLVSGIANPRSLYDEVTRKHLLPVTCHKVFPDHAPVSFTSIDLSNAKSVLTTAKDYYRNPAIFQNLEIPVFILQLHIEWIGSSLTDYLSKNLQHHREK